MVFNKSRKRFKLIEKKRKCVIAFIKPMKLSRVASAIQQTADLSGMTVSDVRGCGRGKGKNEVNQIIEDLISYIPHV